MSKDPRVFHWTRDPLPTWQRALERIAPRRDHVSHLTMHWVPMQNQRRAQRWVVFECTPVHYARHLLPFVYADADDPMIWWTRHYLEETGCIPSPFWVCQGNAMGHPYKYNAMERAASRMGDLPPEPPWIGLLAYAEPTDYTWEAIRRRSTLNRKIADAMTHRAAEQEKANRHLRWQVAQRVEDDMRHLMDEHGKAIYEEYAKPVATTAKSKANATDDHFDAYIETGRLPLPNVPLS